jgi:acetyl-CoA carboxylase biotin carboxylase subunit
VKKILVANRGEIALRVIRAARELDLATVAVYSTADADSLHVKFADEAVCIGPPVPAQSYLHIPAIIAAAEITAADAIHPGYGFLAENAEFAQTCVRSGFTFIGPSPEAIRLMGDKIEGRRAMARHGLLSLPGSEGPLATPEEATEVAHQIGFPVIIKAAAGGGGRGMKIVREAAHFPRALDAARAEAKAAFKNDAVYVERYVERPRHIELQVAADHHGNIVHLGERECSVQRRYQKIIEEAPSPALTPEARAQIGARVVTALKALGYQSLGTVELLMDEAGALHFMEMNTRVQVEHPVTEMLVGRDLVRLQLMIAQGHPLPFRQEDVRFEGHAIECRINAEDPVRFAPCPGTITAFHVPGGPGLRVDTHVTAGSVIPPHYDSLVAKVVVHDVDRAHAIRRMQSALRELVVEGIQTNQAFHRRVLAHEAFRTGDYDTTLVPRIQSEA